jgi:hypothetical protein
MKSKFMLDIEEAERINIQKGFYWFSKGTKRFFGSSISRTLYSNDGKIYYFWSKEDSGFIPPITKKWSVRRFNYETGEVDTIGEFCEHNSVSSANAKIKELLEAQSKEGD